MEYSSSNISEKRYRVDLTSRAKTGITLMAVRVMTGSGIFEILRRLDERFSFFEGEQPEKLTIKIEK